MRLLLDANLSWRSVSVLKAYFDDCFHVDRVGLSVPAKDFEIWEYARKYNLIIVSSDDDFLNLSLMKGFPPKIVLLRTYNQRRQVKELLLINNKAHIVELQSSTEHGVLEIFATSDGEIP